MWNAGRFYVSTTDTTSATATTTTSRIFFSFCGVPLHGMELQESWFDKVSSSPG
jgi:hypothetical protein